MKCPSCGSVNVTFNREKQGEVRVKNGTVVIRSTVGFCKDCGYTWHIAGSGNQPKKNNMRWWVLGWIFFFPAPVMVLIWRKKCRWNIKIKIGVTVAFWLLIFVIGGMGNSDSSSASITDASAGDNTITVGTANTTSRAHIYDDAEVLDLMNGTGTEKIGTITVAKANQADCTEDALYDWYVDYVKKNSDSNYHVIVYNDIKNKGVYSNGFGFIQKDIAITSDNGTYMTGDDVGSTYYTVDETAQKLVAGVSMSDSSVIENIKAKVDAVIPEEYKNSEIYSVDVAGEEGNVDCNITLVNKAFTSGDCQTVAEELATKVKELDLGIGYFCIVFQSDDYTMTAISSMDSLKNQEAAEIIIKTF